MTTKIRIHYNAPFTLSFALICAFVLLLSYATGGWVLETIFSVDPLMSWSNPLSYLRLFVHVFGHANVEHFFYNISILLLVGPILEEKYGWRFLIVASILTALITSILTVMFMDQGVLGASGIVFTFIILGSFTNVRRGTIPLTFVLVVFIYLGNEVISAFNKDNISQLAHLVGGIVGGFLGFMKSE